MKLLFLADVEHCRRHGRPITGLTYRRTFTGIYAPEIEDVILDLLWRGVVIERAEKLYPSIRLVFHELADSEKHIIAELIIRHKQHTAHDLKKHITSIPYIKQQRFGARINPEEVVKSA